MHRTTDIDNFHFATSVGLAHLCSPQLVLTKLAVAFWHKWKGFLLPTYSWKTFCRPFNWMFQLSFRQTWRKCEQTPIFTYSHAIL